LLNTRAEPSAATGQDRGAAGGENVISVIVVDGATTTTTTFRKELGLGDARWSIGER